MGQGHPRMSLSFVPFLCSLFFVYFSFVLFPLFIFPLLFFFCLFFFGGNWGKEIGTPH